jgi:hypothetical protein
MPLKRASAKHRSRRVFGHPGGLPKTTLRAALSARVSSHDQQTLPMQNRALREYPARRGWAITMQVKEVGSGASQRRMREKLMEAARAETSTWCWSGAWIAGEYRSPICLPHCRNWNTSMSAPCR